MLIKKLFYITLLAVSLLVSGVVIGQNKSKQAKVLISTEFGDIKIALYNETPQHRDNFIKLVKSKFYDGTLFHRVMNEFMIQGGDPESKTAKEGALLGDGDVGYTIPGEFNSSLIHKKGVLAAAREPDNINPTKASSGCQFYIVEGRTFTKAEVDKILKGKNSRREDPITYTEEQYKIYETIGGSPHLDMDYTVFGEVLEGMDVVDKITEAETDKRNRPTKDIKMTIKIVKK
ncbi:MAG: peptidylprolyl isomerase [Flavobacteriales bacterium]|nr:peptidylprolyl isomerase [Flavobacteriales bacterium]MCB9364463.1 peptidylprolyl isomerase [Flavobacteriales bacterium]